MLRQNRLLLVLIIVLIFMTSLVQSQDSINVTIFIEEDSLVVSVPESGTISLEGFAFEVTVNGESRIWLLQNFDGFQIPFNRIPTPICFRLSRGGSSPILPQTCEPTRVLDQNLNPADVFWYDRITGLFRTLLISQVENSVGFCGAGQSQCEITYRLSDVVEPEISITIEPALEPLFSQERQQLAENGRGLATGRSLTDGNFEVETYCESIVNNIYGMRLVDTDWFCTYNGWDTRRLVKDDFTKICQLTYHADAFAEQPEGRSDVNSWRCYEITDGTSIVPRQLSFDIDSVVRESLLRRQTNLWSVPDVFDGVKTNTILEGNTVIVAAGPERGRIRTAAANDRDDWYFVVSTDDTSLNGWTWIGNLSAFDEADRPVYRRRLSQEDTGLEVMLLQARLTELDYNPGIIDGYFGRMVDQAVKEFQESEGIVATGVIDENTWIALFGEPVD